MSLTIPSLIQQVQSGISQQSFIKMVIGNKRNKTAELKNIVIKLVALKEDNKLSFVYRYPTNEVTKNYSVSEGLPIVVKLFEQDFFNADLFTTNADYHFSTNEKGVVKMMTKPASLSTKVTIQTHDKQKHRNIQPANNVYLHALGITTAAGEVKKDKQDKYRQINHYIEIIDGIIKDLAFDHTPIIVDMGSGKGYLTFALYDYLQHKLRTPAMVKGIELREGLVQQCNAIAIEAGFKQLHFEMVSIANAELGEIDMLIALHACDTATDDAIYKGIQANARVIICAPCCHKQIRRQMKPSNALANITKHGILLERQAEIVTDSIRAMILEMHGYKTKVFEFISTEHTPKNVLIVGTKSDTANKQPELIQEKINELKALFNIEEHYLESLVKKLI